MIPRDRVGAQLREGAVSTLEKINDLMKLNNIMHGFTNIRPS